MDTFSFLPLTRRKSTNASMNFHSYNINLASASHTGGITMRPIDDVNGD